MSKRRVGLVMMITGILDLAAGLSLGGYNLWDNYRAGIQAAIIMDDIVQRQEETTAEALDGDPEVSPDLSREMPVLEIDGKRYIGTISIPAVDIELPVQENWSPSLLRTAPCRYKGSVYDRDLIICSHNYVTHFGRLKNLITGDNVIFTDIDGSESWSMGIRLVRSVGAASCQRGGMAQSHPHPSKGYTKSCGVVHAGGRGWKSVCPVHAG